MKKFYYYYFNISEDSHSPIENPEIDIHVHEDDMHLESEQKMTALYDVQTFQLIATI